LDEKETNGKNCIKSASTYNEAKTIFVPNWFYDPTREGDTSKVKLSNPPFIFTFLFFKFL
jgi:hypothetical protein